MENLNPVFFGVWHFFDEYLFFLWAFLILISIFFSIIYQFHKRP